MAFPPLDRASEQYAAAVDLIKALAKH